MLLSWKGVVEIDDVYFPALAQTHIKYLNLLSGPFFELVLIPKTFVMTYSL